MEHVYVVEAGWDWEGDTILGIASSLSVARRIVRDHYGQRIDMSRIEPGLWLARKPRIEGRIMPDSVSITRTKVRTS